MLRPTCLIPDLPRRFWPLALGCAGALAALLLLGPLAAMFAHGSTCYNEGFSAYYTRESLQGVPLYGKPPGLTCNNYPPVSFHLIGLLSPAGGENMTGRWIALLSLALVASLCGAIVALLSRSFPLAAFAGLSVVIWMAVYKPDRIGMNDPQLLGTVFSLAGLYLYIRWPERSGPLALSAVAFVISIFTKHNLLALPCAVGAHLLLGRKWTNLAMWGGVAAIGSVLILLGTRWVDGPYLLSSLIMPRAQSGWLTHVTEYARLFQAPIALAVIWALRNLERSPGLVMVLAAVFAHLFAAAFAGGDGVDKNIFFDSMFSLVIVGALAFAEFAPLLDRLLVQSKVRSVALAALLLAPSSGILIETPLRLRYDWFDIKSLRSRASDFDTAVELLKSRPGPALCEDLLVCFEAGKPFAYDPFMAYARIKIGRLDRDDVAAMIESKSFTSVQLNKASELTPEDQPLFPSNMMRALLVNYRVKLRLAQSVVLVPNE